MSTLRPNQIDVSKIEYTEMRPFGEHAKIIYVSHNSKPIIVQTPLMNCPYGLSCYEGGDVPKFTLDMSFRGIDENSKIKEFYDMLAAIDNKILEDSSKKSFEWFKKKNQSKDVSEALYTKAIREAMENGEPTDKYPPTFKSKIPYQNGKFKVTCYNVQREEITDEFKSILTKGQSVRGLVKLQGIWFAGGKFGSTWELVQLKLTPKKNIAVYSFRDDDDED